MDIFEMYEVFNEDERLSSQAASVEYLTTLSFINRYLRDGSKILEIGAGTGAYSLYFSEMGYDVTAVELVSKNLEIMREKADSKNLFPKMHEGNAINLDFLEADSYDLVLCLGPLYHLASPAEKMKCIDEAKRVCKPNGLIFFAYISNDMVFVTESMYNHDYLNSGLYNPENFELVGGPFYFMKPPQMCEFMDAASLKKVHHFAADGLSELLRKNINTFDKNQFDTWLRFHMSVCEKPELLGFSNHIVYVTQK